MYQARIHQRMADLDPAAWDRLWADSEGATPFMRYAFLNALEETGCVSPERGWGPVHLTLWTEDKTPELIAVAPAYIKADSMGDFSRDWSWVHAFRAAGASYYPKLVLCVPFTPVTGRRFLVRADQDRDACIKALVRLGEALAEENDLSSLQILYHHPDEAEALEAAHLSPRLAFQFHWYNRDYECREDFLATFRSKRRTQLKREWRAPEEANVYIETIRGDALRADPKLWARRTYQFYRETVQRFMWGDPYLSCAFYERIFAEMADNMEVVAATDPSGKLLAGAFNVSDDTHLWGRYWGGHEQIPFLHFGVCFYHSIDDCIRRGIQVFEGGEGGQHKLRRGFEPSPTHHAFRFMDPRMSRIVGSYLERERDARQSELDAWREEARR